MRCVTYQDLDSRNFFGSPDDAGDTCPLGLYPGLLSLVSYVLPHLSFGTHEKFYGRAQRFVCKNLNILWMSRDPLSGLSEEMFCFVFTKD